jgi:SAM-dependent methyltransferase
VSVAGLKVGDVVLDLGSGAGIDLLLAAKKVGAGGRVIGVDMTDEMIAKARENIRAAGHANVEVRQGVIEQLPVDTGSIDWVISNCVINLSPEKSKVFAEIARVLKPGGQMLVSDMMAHDLPAELRAVPAFYASCVGGAIPEEEYLAGLRAVGLADVEIRGRLVYDADQLYGYAVSTLEEDPSALAGLGTDGGDARSQARLRAFVASIAGKICSAKVYARKPL